MGGRRRLSDDPIPRSFFERQVLDVAPALLGCRLVAGRPPSLVAARIVEVEAYGGDDDPASHAFRGRTSRNATMFGPAGRAYVYFTYGLHHCVNVVTGSEGRAAAVLLRAGSIIDGKDLARVRRGAPDNRELARGPARLTVALGIDRSHDAIDLTDPESELRLLTAVGETGPIVTSARVGVSAGAERPWRFFLRDEPTVSAYRPGGRRRPRADP